jgi:hypothetical protein
MRFSCFPARENPPQEVLEQFFLDPHSHRYLRPVYFDPTTQTISEEPSPGCVSWNGVYFTRTQQALATADSLRSLSNGRISCILCRSERKELDGTVIEASQGQTADDISKHLRSCHAVNVSLHYLSRGLVKACLISAVQALSIVLGWIQAPGHSCNGGTAGAEARAVKRRLKKVQATVAVQPLPNLGPGQAASPLALLLPGPGATEAEKKAFAFRLQVDYINSQQTSQSILADNQSQQAALSAGIKHGYEQLAVLAGVREMVAIEADPEPQPLQLTQPTQPTQPNSYQVPALARQAEFAERGSWTIGWGDEDAGGPVLEDAQDSGESKLVLKTGGGLEGDGEEPVLQ